MDEADRAAQEVDRELAEAMRLRKPPGPLPTGRCLYCEEDLGDDYRRWCNIECREGWETEARRGR